MKRSAWLACAAALCFSIVSLSRADRQEDTGKQRSLPDATTWKYFPQPSVSRLMPYIAEFLNSSDEPSLLARAQDPSAVSYRFNAWLMPYASFRVIRFSLNSDGTATVVKSLLPRATNPSAPAKPNKVDVNVSAEDTAKFLALVDSSGFWAMPTVEPPNPTPPKYYVLDGAFWIFEGVRNGAYHVVDRPNPVAGPFTEMVHFLAKDLAGLNESESPSGIRPPGSSPPNHGVAIELIGKDHHVGEILTIRLTNRTSQTVSTADLREASGPTSSQSLRFLIFVHPARQN